MSNDDFEDLIAVCEVKKPKNKTFKKAGDSIGSVCVGMVKTVKPLFLLYIFLMYIIINSGSFVRGCLSKFPNTVEGSSITEKGIILQSIVFVLLCAVFLVLEDFGVC